MEIALDHKTLQIQDKFHKEKLFVKQKNVTERELIHLQASHVSSLQVDTAKLRWDL